MKSITIFINVYPNGVTTIHGSREDAESSSCSNRVKVLERLLKIPLEENAG